MLGKVFSAFRVATNGRERFYQVKPVVIACFHIKFYVFKKQGVVLEIKNRFTPVAKRQHHLCAVLVVGAHILEVCIGQVVNNQRIAGGLGNGYNLLQAGTLRKLFVVSSAR